MTSIKTKFRPSAIDDREGTVYYQIIRHRKIRQILSEYKLKPSEWDERRSSVCVSGTPERRRFLSAVRERIRRDIERLGKIDRQFESSGLAYTTDDIIDEFQRYASESRLFTFMQTLIVRFRQNGNLRTSETYTAALNSFKKFLSSLNSSEEFPSAENIRLDSLTADLMESYEAWHRKRGVSYNTISFYTRILRAVYNRAVELDLTDNRNPFRHVYTGVDKTVKRAVSLSTLKKICSLDLSATPRLDFARDMFMLSFYLRGMSFVDMAFLKKTDLCHGYVTYRRRKTGQRLTISWTKEMQAIIEKYPVNTSVYLLPIIRCPDTNERKVYRNTAYAINRNLKRIAELTDISIPLTLYVARHSWASTAKSIGIPISVISEGMGHDSETTTQIYLASLDTSVIDRANNRILASLK
ncbi:MAG: site-specific integrase [Muribaculaceae bacterium]|nr:site-specific integrase [Muribaculaceae bacterium]